MGWVRLPISLLPFWNRPAITKCNRRSWAQHLYLLCFDSFVISGVLEIQQIHCRGATNGTFRLSFRGNVSRPIPFDADASALKTYIEEIYTSVACSIIVHIHYKLTFIGIFRISSVNVELNDTAICNANKAAAYITFLTEYGDLPMMRPTAVSLQVLPAATPGAPMHIIRVTEEQKGLTSFVSALISSDHFSS